MIYIHIYLKLTLKKSSKILRAFVNFQLYTETGYCCSRSEGCLKMGSSKLKS